MDFLRDPKKYTFGKVNFKTFYKNRKSEILPPFLSTFNTWMIPELVIFVSVDGGHVCCFTLGPSVLAPHVLQIKPLVYSFVVSCVVLQKDILRENT